VKQKEEQVIDAPKTEEKDAKPVSEDELSESLDKIV